MSESAVEAAALVATPLQLGDAPSAFRPGPATPVDPASAGAGRRGVLRFVSRRPGLPLPAPIAALCAVGAGLLLWLAFPGVGWWPLAPVALAALNLAVFGQRPGRGAWIGFLAGLAFFIPHLHWSGVYVGALPWLALSALEAGYIAGLAAALTLVWRARGGAVTTVIGTAGLWVAQEALRGRTPFGGFPWARVAFSQADSPALGYAALGGAPLVTGAVAGAGACLAIAVVKLVDRSPAGPAPANSGPADPAPSGRTPARPGPDGRRGLSAILALVASLAVLSAGTLVPRPVDAPRTAQVAAVQGNVPTAGLEFNAQRRAVLDDHARVTQELAARVAAGAAPRPQVVLWPENSSDIDPLVNADAAQVIQSATDAVGAPILIGAVLLRPPGQLSNAGIVWGPTGSSAPGPGVRYVKRHPAPFAEYIPYRSFFRHFSDKVDLVVRDFASGDSVGVLPAGGVKLGDVICFEVAYDDLVRDPVRAGADLLVVQTNNATFGYTDESVQQLAMSRLRAVETGRAVVHISTVGVSALIAPDGHEIVRSGHFTAQVLQAALPLRTAQTLATRLGGYPELAMAGLGVLIAALGLRRRQASLR